MKGEGPSRRSGEGQLLDLWHELDADRRTALLEFAAFLVARAEVPAPARIVTLRPEQERVVHAVRRLNGSYPMLERAKLLQPVGDLLSQHLVDGRAAAEVIDALEALYAASYAALLEKR